MGLPQRYQIEKTVMEGKHTQSQVKKKFRARWSIKKSMLTVFWDMTRPIIIDFLEKSETENCVSHI